jgi:predicted ATPase/class 3 adenylate cyclase
MRKLHFDHAQIAAKLLTNSLWVGAELATKSLAQNSPAAQLLTTTLGLARSTIGDSLTKGLTQRLTRQENPPPIRDLNRAIGAAIAQVLHFEAKHDASLTPLADAAPAFWTTLAENERSLLYSEVTEYFATHAEQADTVTALTAEQWRAFLTDLAVEAKVKLTEGRQIDLGDRLHTGFASSLRQVLLEDEAQGGRSYSEVMFMIVGEITAMLREGQAEERLRHAELLSRLEGLHEHILEGLPAQRDQDTPPTDLRLLPAGMVTFLFTDIEESTRQWEVHPDQMASALRRHDILLREVIEKHRGVVFKTMGDAFCAAFYTALDAATATIAAQERLFGEEWPEGIRIRIRMALNSGEAEIRDNDYFGPPLNRTARLLAAGHGGQILVASSTQELLGNRVPLLDMGMHRLRDLPLPERIFAISHSHLPTDLPPLKTIGLAVHNMPQQLTAFVGREREVTEWAYIIHERSKRLFTVTGFGGLGKTRVAIEIGKRLLSDFPDGVWWCSLEQAVTANEAITRLAEALSLSLQPSPGVKEQLLRYLHDRNLLLILDNLEQVSDGPRFVKDLLAETTQLVCLITSRHIMDLRGEIVLELAPLSRTESVELFAERATESRTEFALDEETMSDVDEICRKLEGVPLAIELAAARIAGMTPRQILQRLSERFRLLQSRSQELNERQRALKGAIDWSYALLSEEDKQVFAQLTIFSGGFTLEDAEAVCEAYDVFESVMALRHQSFTRFLEGTVRQEQRFVMLDSLREYGAEKLAGTNDRGEGVKNRHAEWFLEFAHKRLAKLRTSDEQRAMAEMKECEGNLFAALEWALVSRNNPLIAQLSLAAGSLRMRRGFVQSAVEIIQQGLECAASLLGTAPALVARLYLERAGLHYDFREGPECRSLAAEALALFESAGERHGIAQAENQFGQADMLCQDYAGAISHYRRAQELFAQVGDPIGVAIALNNHGLAERRDQSGTDQELAERRGRASEHFQEALRLRRELDDRRGLAETLNNLGVLSFDMQNYAEAWRYYLEALQYERQLDHLHGMGIALANLGETADTQGNPNSGARLLVTSERLLSAAGSPLVQDVRALLNPIAARAELSDTEINDLRSRLQSLSVAECCDWALE